MNAVFGKMSRSCSCGYRLRKAVLFALLACIVVAINAVIAIIVITFAVNRPCVSKTCATHRQHASPWIAIHRITIPGPPSSTTVTFAITVFVRHPQCPVGSLSERLRQTEKFGGIASFATSGGMPNTKGQIVTSIALWTALAAYPDHLEPK